MAVKETFKKQSRSKLLLCDFIGLIGAIVHLRAIAPHHTQRWAVQLGRAHVKLHLRFADFTITVDHPLSAVFLATYATICITCSADCTYLVLRNSKTGSSFNSQLLYKWVHNILQSKWNESIFRCIHKRRAFLCCLLYGSYSNWIPLFLCRWHARASRTMSINIPVNWPYNN